MLLFKNIKQFTLALALLAASVTAHSQQPRSEKPISFTLETSCSDCKASVRAAELPSSIVKIAEVAQSEEFKNRTIFYKDDLKPMSHARGEKFAPVGMLADPRNRRTETATLVSECHIYTSRHLIDTTAEVEQISQGLKSAPARLKFLVGAPGNGRPFETVISARPVAWGDYEASDPDISKDWMLLELDNCAGSADKYGHIKIEAKEFSELEPGEALVKAGYPSTRDPKFVWVDDICKAHSSNASGYVYNDCASVKGDSGGGLFIKKKDGSLRLFATQLHGINSELVHREYTQGDANVGLTLKPVLSRIRPHIPYLNETNLSESSISRGRSPSHR